jgi:hypothetical protein
MDLANLKISQKFAGWREGLLSLQYDGYRGNLWGRLFDRKKNCHRI